MRECKLKSDNIKQAMKLYLVTDRQWLHGECLRDIVSECIIGGVTCVQVREKDCEHEAFVNEAYEVQSLCREHNILCIINDDVDVMQEIDADGIHVGQHDQNAREVRQRIGTDKVLGVSVQTVEQAIQAQSEGADYVGVGAIFSTNTKTDADDVSYDTLKAICIAIQIPVVAIGGIQMANIKELRGSGIDGIAVVSAIMAQGNKKGAIKGLLGEIDKL